jgi:hypothetical protein
MDLKKKAVMTLVVGSSLFLNVAQADSQNRLKGCAAKNRILSGSLVMPKHTIMHTA